MIRTLRVLLCLAVFAELRPGADVINGAGATFPILFTRNGLANTTTSIPTQFNYQSIGSGGGIRRAQAGTG